MAIVRKSIRYTSVNGDSVNWLLANIGDKIVIEHTIAVSTFSINSTQNEWILNNKDGYFSSGSEIWVTGGDFSEFNVGDEVQIANYTTNTVNGSAFIVEKPSNTEIKLNSNPVGWTANTSGSQDVFSVKRKPTALYYKWNWIENGEATNFGSKVDGVEHVAYATGIDAGVTTPIVMIQLGTNPHKVGSISVKGVALNTNPVYENVFKITHETLITPILLANQWDDILNGIPPDDYLNNNCLRPVYYFESRYSVSNPNDVQTLLEDSELGNTGWYNENFNTKLTNYSISNKNWLQQSPSVSIPSAQLKVGNYSSFTFDVDNTTDNPFTAGGGCVLNFAKAPNLETEYQNNSRDLRHNFVWETATLVIGTTPTAINGDNFADSSMRSLTTLKATLISSSKIRITGRIDMLQPAIDVFEESEEPRYIFFISVFDKNKVDADSDRVTLLVEATPFYYKVEYPDLIVWDTKLIPHDVPNYLDAFDLRDIFTEDELVGFSKIRFKSYDVNPPDTIEFIRGTAKLVVRNTTTSEEFTLEGNTINVSNAPFINGFQYFNIVNPKAHHIPANEIRKDIKFWFDPIPDGFGFNYYYFAYPYLSNWEYWTALSGVNQYFFDTTKPNNGYNKDWINYQTGDWTVSYKTELALKVNGVPAVYTNYIDYRIYDRNYNDGSNSHTFCEITTHDPDTNTELIDISSNKYILGYKNTLVKATFTNNNSPFSNPITDFTVVFGVELFEDGGINGKRRMSSRYVSDADTWFLPLTGETKVKLTAIGTDTLLAEVLIDNNLINLNKSKYKLTARLYYKLDLVNFPSTNVYPIITSLVNYLGSQDVYLIKNNPIDTKPTVITDKKLDCGSDFIWRVLADTSNANDLRNDKNSFYWFFDKDAIDTAILYLVKEDGTDINLTSNSTYGIPYNYGFFVNGNNEKMIGYLIDWRKVLIGLGECVYKIKCVTTTIFGGTQTLYSDSYCLKQYTDARAENTVRVEYYRNGIIGSNLNDAKYLDFGTLNWYNQHRFEGVFSYLDSTYKETEVQYTNGQLINVEDEQTAEYSLNLKSIPAFKHDVLRTDILQSDKILITDYNSKNANQFYQKEVKRVGDFAPKWNILRTKLAPIELKFKQKYNTLRKFIS